MKRNTSKRTFKDVRAAEAIGINRVVDALEAYPEAAEDYIARSIQRWKGPAVDTSLAKAATELMKARGISYDVALNVVKTRRAMGRPLLVQACK